MGALRDAFDRIYRDHVTAGIPGTGAHDPEKIEIRSLGPLIEQLLANFGAVGVIYDTAAEGLAETPDGKIFLVKGDGETGAIDLYLNDGGTAVFQDISIPSQESIELALQAIVDDLASTIALECTGSGLIIRDKDGNGIVRIDRRGHLHRNMTREPAQHARGGVTALVDSNGWAAQAFASDGSPIPVGGTLHRIISQILHVIFYGQSNAIGVEALPLQPALANSRVLMFAGGVRPWNSTTPDPGTPDYSSLTTLIEEDDANQGGTLHAGETPASGWAMGFMDGITARFGLTLADLNAYLLMSAAGQGSTPAMYLRRDQGYAYPRLVEQQKAGFARAQALGRTFAQSVIHMDLGEADTSLQTSSAEYQRLLLRILTDIERDASTANGRFSPAVMTMCQLSSFNIIGAGTYRDIAYAQAEFARVNPFAILSAPAYMSDYVQTPGGGLHKDGWSNRLSGYYAGRAYAQSLQLDGGGLYFDPDRKFRPTEMLSASRQGPRLVEALFNVPVGPLVFDTTRVSDPGSYGFTIARPGVGVIAISGTPVIHGRNKIIITAAADLRPGDQLIYGAAETPDGSTKRAGRQFGPRGCVADSATDMFDPTGINFRARNYCIHGAVPII